MKGTVVQNTKMWREKFKNINFMQKSSFILLCIGILKKRGCVIFVTIQIGCSSWVVQKQHRTRRSLERSWSVLLVHWLSTKTGRNCSSSAAQDSIFNTTPCWNWVLVSVEEKERSWKLKVGSIGKKIFLGSSSAKWDNFSLCECFLLLFMYPCAKINALKALSACLIEAT